MDQKCTAICNEGEGKDDEEERITRIDDEICPATTATRSQCSILLRWIRNEQPLDLLPYCQPAERRPSETATPKCPDLPQWDNEPFCGSLFGRRRPTVQSAASRWQAGREVENVRRVLAAQSVCFGIASLSTSCWMKNTQTDWEQVIRIGTKQSDPRLTKRTCFGAGSDVTIKFTVSKKKKTTKLKNLDVH